MADYIYLLEHRLSSAQRSALREVRELARSRSLTVFLVGGAVRDLTSGSPVRDLDVVVQGNALKLRKDLEKAGATYAGEHEAEQSLYLTFPGSVRVEVGSTLSVTYPKPNKPVYRPAAILEDLRRRDFTANAMALSLNEGSYGLLMDPLNGVADIENRELRLISNYGFIEDPIRMVRAARLMARLGWAMDERTQQRYETGKDEDYIAGVTDFQRGYELEEIAFEEDPLRVLRRLEAEGWMKALAPFWTTAKVNTAELEKLREAQTQLQMQGIHPDASAVQFPLLTGKLAAKEIESLKALFPRKGFVAEIDGLEAKAKELGATLTGKAAALPSQAWRLLTSAPAEVVLELAYTTRSAAVQGKLKSFYTVWPTARQKMPYALMQEMRITPEVDRYDELLEKLFFELMDERLGTPEELKAFMEPYSPPAPPPTVTVRRPRAAKAAKSKAKAKKVLVDQDADEMEDDAVPALPAEIEDEVVEALGGTGSGSEDADDAEKEGDADESDDEEEDDDSPAPRPVKAAKKPAVKSAPAKALAAPAAAAVESETVAAKAPAKAASAGAAKPVAPAKAVVPAKPVVRANNSAPVESAPVKAAAVKTAPAKAAPVKATPAKSTPARAVPATRAADKKAAVAAPVPRRPLAAAKKAAVVPAKKGVVKAGAVKAAAVKVAAKKALPAKKAAPAKQVVPAKKAVVAKRVSPPAKKAAGKAVPAKAVPSKAASKKAVPAKKRR